MMIEDEELRLLYKISSEEHLQKLEADLMILEKNPQDTEALEEFLREAHTLKGDSRMLGLNEIEKLVHHLEDCVEGIKAGQSEITPELCDRLYQGIDAIEQLSHHAITGESVRVDAAAVLASLSSPEQTDSSFSSEADLFDDDDDFFGSSNSPAASATSEADLFDDDDDFFGSSNSPAASATSETDLFDDDDPVSSEIDLKADLFADIIPEAELEEKPEPAAKIAAPTDRESAVTPVVNRDRQINTIRVDPQKLDVLVTQASELAVTKLRISQQMADIEQIMTLLSRWSPQDDLLTVEIEQAVEPEVLLPLKQYLNSTEQRVDTLGSLITNLRTRATEDTASLEIISDRLETGINGLRQLPLSTVFNIYPRMVRVLARQQNKKIELLIQGEDTKVDKRILEEIKDPLLHLIRNAIDHGIETPAERLAKGKSETAILILRGYQIGDSIGIEISDDGRGLDVSSICRTAIRRRVKTEAEIMAMNESQIQSLIFASGFSTRTEITELSGRGVGLDVVRTNVERLKGSIQVSSVPGNGCKFQMRLNTSLATTKILLVEVDETLYGIPLEFIQTMITLTPQDIYEIEDKKTITFAEKPISVSPLGSLLGLPTPETNSNSNYLNCIVLEVKNNTDDLTKATQCFGIIVDDLVDQQDVVLKPQSKLLKRVPNIAGATILGSGEVCMVLNPTDLLHSIKNGSWQSDTDRSEANTARKRLLLVEDSIIIRTQMQRLLKGKGYDVTIAENGLLGLQRIQAQEFDIVLSDVEMPEMSGLEMTTNVRQNSKYDRLPIVLITTLASPEDKHRGAAAGANAYLTKGDFDRQLLFATLDRLIYAHH